MAATVDKEPGLGAPMRLAIQNALNQNQDLASETSDHLAQVTGHAPSTGWRDFSNSLALALEDPKAAEYQIGKMVEALGFHEDNFASQFEEHKFDKQKTLELKEDLHELSSMVGEYIGTLVDAVHEAKASPRDQQKASDAYEAGYDLANFLHVTHTMNEGDHELLDAEAAHVMSQLELKNYRSGVDFASPDQIGGVLKRVRKKAGEAWGKTKRVARKVRRAASKTLIPEDLRRFILDFNIVAGSTIILGGVSSIPDVFLERGCIVQTLSTHLLDSLSTDARARYEILDAEQERYNIQQLEQARGGRWFGRSPDGKPVEMQRDLTFALTPDDIQHFGATFTMKMRVQNMILQEQRFGGSAPPPEDVTPIEIGGTDVPQNVILFSNPRAMQAGATGVIFPQSTVSEDGRTFYMSKNAVVQVSVTVTIRKGNTTEDLVFHALIQKFNPANRGAIRTIDGLIGAGQLPASTHAKLEELGFELKKRDANHDVYTKGGIEYAFNHTTGNLDYVRQGDGDWVKFFVSSEDIPREFGENRGPEYEFGGNLGWEEDEPPLPSSAAAPRNRRVDDNLLPSFADLMKDRKMIVMQIKKHDSKGSQKQRPYLLLFLSIQDATTGRYTIDGVLLVFPRTTPKRKIPQKERNTLTSMQRNQVSSYRNDARAARRQYKESSVDRTAGY